MVQADTALRTAEHRNCQCTKSGNPHAPKDLTPNPSSESHVIRINKYA